MDIFGIGPLELFFIILIALIVLGPKDMAKAGRSLGRTMRKVVTSDNWRTMQQVSREIRTIQNRLIREAGLEEAQKEIATFTTVELIPTTGNPKNSDTQPGSDLADWTTPQNSIAPPSTDQESTDKAAK